MRSRPSDCLQTDVYAKSRLIYFATQITYYRLKFVRITSFAMGQDKSKLDKPDEQMEKIDTGLTNDEVKEGEMRDVEIEGAAKVLVVRQNGKLYAIGSKCTHYGAPLSKGVLCNGRIRCPWHGACFNVETGDIEDFPGLDSLPKYAVEVDRGRIFLRARTEDLKQSKRTKWMAGTTDPRHTFVIVGGGGAAAECAEALRQEGFDGRLLLYTKESAYPYDRPRLSKSLDSTPEALYLRSAEFYEKHDIDVRLNVEVIRLDTSKKKVYLSNGSSEPYDRILLASGGSPRTLDKLPGANLENIFVLRTPQNGNEIFARAKEADVVIVGNGFIGMEVAAYFVGKARSITVVGRSRVPFEKILGPQIGQRFQQLHEEKGTRFVSGRAPAEFLGDGQKLTGVRLDDGNELKADVCLVGAGVVPSTSYLKGSDVKCTKDGLVIVDNCMRTSNPDVYAAGDIVQFPLEMLEGQRVNIGHWQMALAHVFTATHEG